MGLIARISTWLRGAFNRSAALSPIEIISPPPLWDQVQRIGGGLTVQDVSNILLEADAGQIGRFIDLAVESREKDGHLHSLLQGAEMAVSSRRLHIEPFSDKPEDKLIADWCAEWAASFGDEQIDGEDVLDLPGLIEHMQSGEYFGFSVSETLFAKDGSRVRPVGALPVQHRRFCFDLDDGRLRFCDVGAGVSYPGIDLRAEFPGRIIQYQPRVFKDAAAREGLARLLVWLALFRNWNMADWIKLAEIAWKPYRIGTYFRDRDAANAAGKPVAGTADIVALKTAMTGLTTNGVALLSNAVDFKIEWPKGARDGQSAHEALLKFFAGEMSKAVNGQTLTVEQGDRGARSLGEVHERKELTLEARRASRISRALRRDLFAPAVELNFGHRRAPKVSLVRDNLIPIEQLAPAVKALGEAGLAMPADWVRGQIGMPSPKKGDEIV